jgi:hypothetical protein
MILRQFGIEDLLSQVLPRLVYLLTGVDHGPERLLTVAVLRSQGFWNL